MTVVVEHISLPKLGERANGDAVVVCNGAGERLLIGVIDGLGHGPIAAEASSAAVTRLKREALEQGVQALMMHVHDALKGTRGAAATLCLLNGRKLEACAVGNVQLLCTNTSIPLVLSAGVLGARVTKYRVCEAQLNKAARIAIYSDGISSRLRSDEIRTGTASEACKVTIERHRKKEDDATILVADVDG